MPDTIDVTIPVEPDVATALADGRNRDAIGRLISRVFRPHAGPSPLAGAIADLKAEVQLSALSDDEIDAELALYNAEGRSSAGRNS